MVISIMGIVIDILLVLVVLFFVWRSAKRGFVRTLIDLVGYIAAFAVAFSLSGPVAELAYDSLVRPSVTEAVQKSIESGGNSAQAAADAVFDSMPAFLEKAAGNIGITRQSTEEQCSAVISQGAASAADAVAAHAVEPVIMSIFKFLAMLIMLVLLMCIVRAVSRMLNAVISKTPLIGGANRVLGAVLGALKGGIIALLAAALLVIILPLTENGGTLIDSSYVLGFVSSLG